MKRLFSIIFFLIISSTVSIFSAGLVFDFGVGYGSDFDIVNKDDGNVFGEKGEAVYAASLLNDTTFFFPLRINAFLISDRIDFWAKRAKGRLSFAAEFKLLGFPGFSLNLGGGVIKQVGASSDDDDAAVFPIISSTADLIISKALCLEFFAMAPLKQVTKKIVQIFDINVKNLDSIQPAVAGLILKFRII